MSVICEGAPRFSGCPRCCHRVFHFSWKRAFPVEIYNDQLIQSYKIRFILDILIEFSGKKDFRCPGPFRNAGARIFLSFSAIHPKSKTLAGNRNLISNKPWKHFLNIGPRSPEYRKVSKKYECRNSNPYKKNSAHSHPEGPGGLLPEIPP